MRSSMGAMAGGWVEVCSNTKRLQINHERFHNEDDIMTLIMEGMFENAEKHLQHLRRKYVKFTNSGDVVTIDEVRATSTLEQ